MKSSCTFDLMKDFNGYAETVTMCYDTQVRVGDDIYAAKRAVQLGNEEDARMILADMLLYRERLEIIEKIYSLEIKAFDCDERAAIDKRIAKQKKRLNEIPKYHKDTAIVDEQLEIIKIILAEEEKNV